MGTVSVLSVWLLFRFCVPVRGWGLWVSSVPGCESTRGGWVWVGRGEWLQGARAWQPPAGCSEPWAQCSQLISSSFYTSPNHLLETGQAKSSRESRDCTFRQLHSHLLGIGLFLQFRCFTVWPLSLFSGLHIASAVPSLLVQLPHCIRSCDSDLSVMNLLR